MALANVYCGQCGLGFDTPELELAHVCSVTGVKPTEPESMGVNWNTISSTAIDRGAPETTKAKVDSAKQAITARVLLEKSALKPKLTTTEKQTLQAVEAEIV